MPIEGEIIIATRRNIATAPALPGLYALYENDELIYYGRALGGDHTIRSRLDAHKSGREGPCSSAFTHFRYEIGRSDMQRERLLLEEFEAAHGRLPRCNMAPPGLSPSNATVSDAR